MEKGISKPITLAGLGKKLGLDKSTVSLALNNSPRIPAQTKKRVQEAAKAAGYRPNWAARRLAAKKPMALALVLPGTLVSLASQVAARTIQHLAHLAAQRGLLFHLVTAPEECRAEEASPGAGDPDGFFIWGDVPAKAAKGYERLGKPCLILDPSDEGYRDFRGNALSMANREGGALAAEKLAASGASRLLAVRAREGHLGHSLRLEGAMECWRRLRGEEGLRIMDLRQAGGTALAGFCAREHGAIFCTSDAGALEIWHRLRMLGLDAPKDVSLAGFDAEDAGLALGLACVRFDWKVLAERAFEIMDRLLKKDVKKTVNETIPVQWIAGDTA